MKTAAKVFIWIGMILQGIMIFPIVIGYFALKKINNEDPSNYKEFAIVVCFFCSLLGGIFMLCLGNETGNAGVEPGKKVVRARKKNCYEINETEKQAKTRRKLYFCVILQMCLLLLNFVLAIICIENSYLGVADLPYAIFVSILHVMLAVIIAVACLFFIRRKTFNTVTNSLLLFYAIASFVELLASVASNYREGYKNGLKYWNFGEAWECGVMFAISLVTLVVTLYMFIVSVHSKQYTVSVVRHKTSMANNMELEIEEAQRMQSAENAKRRRDYSKRIRGYSQKDYRKLLRKSISIKL